MVLSFFLLFAFFLEQKAFSFQWKAAVELSWKRKDMEAIWSRSFSFNKYVVATVGGLQIGRAVFKEGQILLVEDESFNVPLEKICELMKFFKQLGKDLCEVEAVGEKCLQLPNSTKLTYKEKKLFASSKDKCEVEIVTFDSYTFLSLINAIKMVLLFVVGPTEKEFDAFETFTKELILKVNEFPHDPQHAAINFALEKATNTVENGKNEQFHLKMVLKNHLDLLEAYYETVQLL
jgi:hypothetical protein